MHIKTAAILFASLCASSVTFASYEASMERFMFSDLQVRTTPIKSKHIDKYFNCQFFHVDVLKTSGRSQEVAFAPDTLAIMSNGNIISVSLPSRDSRLRELETCLDTRVSATSKARLKDFHKALDLLYPDMPGVNNHSDYEVDREGVRLISANNFTERNEFYVKMKGGRPSEIHYSKTTGNR